MFQKRLLPLYIAAAVGCAPVFAQDAPANENSDGEASETPPSESVALEEVVVHGVRQAELNARDMERDKKNLSNIIAQDDAGDFADQNVAESLQRLPGITLQKTEGEGSKVGIRGLSPGFVSVSMNGSELASAGEDSRAVSLDLMPSDMLGSIEVNKVLLPNMDLNSIGGNVNVNTLSAFDRGRDSLSVKAQGYYQDYAGKVSPKVSLSGTNLLAEEKIGIGYSLSYEKRETEMYLIDTHSDILPRYLQSDSDNPDSPRVLAPYRYEAKQENAERTRTSGSLDLGFRPTDNQEYYLKVSHTEYKDLDIAMREYYRWGQAGNDDVVYVDSDTGLFGLVDTDLQQQYFIQDGKNSTDSIQLGGENVIADVWTVDYSYAYSKSKWEKPDGRRVQFRARDLPMLGIAGDGWARGEIVPPGVLEYLSGDIVSSAATAGYNSQYVEGETRQSKFGYDNIFIEDSFRDDEVSEFAINLKREFTDSFVNYIQFGYNNKSRERDRNKDRWSVVPDDYKSLGCAGDQQCLQWARSTLGMFDTQSAAHPDIQYEFITYDDAEELLRVTTPIARSTDPNLVGQDSVKDDYRLTEDTSYGYFMAEFSLDDYGVIIAGAQYADTEFSSTGGLSIRNDRFEAKEDATVLDIAIPMEGTTNDYYDFYPHVHYIFEADNNIVWRGSLWTSYTRPSFDQARAFAEMEGRVQLCNENIAPVAGDDPYGDYRCGDNLTDIGATGIDDVAQNFTVSPYNSFVVGNPQLDAMYATNLDFSASWYAEDGTYLQAAVFYKDIQDFIVEVDGVRTPLEALPVDVPVGQVTEFTFIPGEEYYVSTATNGDTAEVYGIELSYSQFFDNGLFVQTNATGIQSSAKLDDSLRVGDFRLPDQADLSFNLTAGWENDVFSARFISNYVSKILKSVGACSLADQQRDQDNAAASAANGGSGMVYPEECKKWADRYQDARFGLDFKAKYNITDSLSTYIDVLNITGEKEFEYSEGNNYSRGNIIYSSEDFGTSFQVGINYKFM